ncbi:hypothetical protein LTR72_007193 [Exophiala xenobiotica]|nr:hypothetical protein LTR41_006589 [Exophiala xenobiotica]KAK5220571.1 hypothetical protein LTR72_007193 [Exophiala xenobiotica]KAK5290844.1 hypothetical protein LTR14_006351 [Exophiala xenobiotica]KAK5497408.1 hypothetical protein LTR55_001900 [Exophiala xenobiotica]
MPGPIRGPYLSNPSSSRADRLKFPTPRFNLWPTYHYSVKEGSPIWDHYQEIKDHILSIAFDSEFGITFEVHHTLCLVGPGEDQLRPAIALHSRSTEYLSRVVERIKESSEWKSFVFRHPLFGLLRSKIAPQTLGMHKETESWSVYTLEPESFAIGSPLCFASKDDPGVFIHMATAGPILSLNGEPYLLIPSHPILLPQSQTSGQGTQFEVDDCCEIDFFDDESVNTGAGRDFREHGSPSPLQPCTLPCESPLTALPDPPNSSTSSEYDLADLSSPNNNSCEQGPSSWHDTNVSTTRFQPGLPLDPTEHLVGEVRYISSNDKTAQHDWALCKIRPWVYEKMVSSGKVNVVHDAGGKQSVSVRGIAKRQIHNITAILTSSVSGGHAGTLGATPSYYRMAGSHTSLEVLTFQTDASLFIGACGSPIIDTRDGSWHGQIIAGEVDAPIGYVLPAIDIVGDIARELDISESTIKLVPNANFIKTQSGDLTSMTTSIGGLYQPLPEDSIRLLTLLPPDKSGMISCSLRTTSLLGKNKYTALSYTWGNSEPRHRIMVDGHEIEIRHNLFKFLSNLSTGWFALDIWVDTLCINQADVIERSSQVRLMDKIFSNAHNVLAWLGEPDSSSDKAMEHVAWASAHMLDPLAYDDDRLVYVVSLLRRPWFQRIWVIQELLFAPRLELLCGGSRLDWDSFASWIVAFVNYANRWAEYRHRSIARLQGLFESENTGFSTALHIASEMKVGVGRTISLESLLCQTTLTICHDPRDRVYSLLRLASTPTVLEIDYGKSPHDLYVDVVVSLIASSDSLDIICRPWAPRVLLVSAAHTQKSGIRNGMPSWIPSIPHEGYEPIFAGPAYKRRAPDVLVGLPGGRRDYSACDGYGVYTALSRDGRLDSGLDIYLQGPGDGLEDNVAYMDSGSPPTSIRESVAMQFACPVKYCGKIVQGQYSKSSNLVRHLRESHMRDQEDLHKIKAWTCFASACTLRAKVLTGYDRFRHHVLHQHPTEDVTLLITKSLKWFQARGRQALIEYRHTLPMLKVRGILISRLEDIGDRAVGGVIPSSWRELGGWPDVQKKPPESFWRTLVADRGLNHAICPLYYEEACRAVFQLARAGADLHTLADVPSSSPFLGDFVSRMQAVVEGRRLALTQVRGAEGERDVPRLAVVPDNTRRGDFIAVLYGCSVPVVLRPAEGADAEEQREYQLIGECYVHGMMNGEALDSADLAEDEREMLLN